MRPMSAIAQKQTNAGAIGLSAKCQKWTSLRNFPNTSGFFKLSFARWVHTAKVNHRPRDFAH
jgi:hypothetical protein